MILYLKKNDDEIDDEIILKKVIEAILSYKLVILPTDTIYGFSGHYESFEIRRRISEIKCRGEDKSFIVLVPDLGSLLSLSKGKIPVLLMRKLPLPLTLIIRTDFSPYWGTRLGVRIPSDGWLRKLLERLGTYIISTSVNISGEEELKAPLEIIDYFEYRVDMMVIREWDLDDGGMDGRLPSTILDISMEPYRVIRQGGYHISEGFLDELRNEPIEDEESFF